MRPRWLGGRPEKPLFLTEREQCLRIERKVNAAIAFIVITACIAALIIFLLQ